MSSTQEAQKQTLGFETEVKQLLQLMIHSLYSNKEIFLRELISNASDACDKLRFEAVANSALYENDPELKIHISFDKDARTLTITDNGIGMNREEVIKNLGTIAKSGTKEFLASLNKDQLKDNHLIGQFGVGFYSAFMVADKVTVLTRRAGEKTENAIRWESQGEGDYTLEQTNKENRGTEIILQMKEDAQEFLDDWRLRNIIHKYSDHISWPIVMQKPALEEKEGEEPKAAEEETVNKAKALWTLSKSDIKEEDYKEFYKHLSHDFEDPLVWSHNRVEGKQEYITLLYVPSRAPFDLWQRDQQYGLKLYVNRVFILDKAEQFLPLYLRFVKGVVDSRDLPLNVSREMLQNHKMIDTIRSACTKKVLSLLEKMASDESEQYAKFWNEFGKVLKEGPAEDYANKEQIAKLLRFASTHTDKDTQDVSLDAYIERMKEGQEAIYYITADSFAAAKNSPHLEIFRKKGIEVLLLTDRIDEWLVSHLPEYNGKQLHSVAKGDLDLGNLEDTQEKEEHKKVEDEYANLVKQVKEALSNEVKEVRITHRLTSSPACVVTDQNDMSLQMQRMFKAAGQDIPVSKPILELNPEHPLIHRLKDEQDDDRFKEWSHILLDQALLAEGSQLEDPASFVQRLNKMLLDMMR
jgi:molecular chaperone HtpG